MRAQRLTCVVTIVRIVNDIKKKFIDIKIFRPRFSALVTVVVYELIVGSRSKLFLAP